MPSPVLLVIGHMIEYKDSRVSVPTVHTFTAKKFDRSAAMLFSAQSFNDMLT
jgi:hypothetical protein